MVIKNVHPKQILLVWELGANFGHLLRLSAIGEALIDRGHRVFYVVRDMRLARELLSDAAVILPSPCLPYVPVQRPPRSMADILAGIGYTSSADLQHLIEAWMSIFSKLSPDCILTEYAPTAQFAATLATIPYLQLATGFDFPPPTAPLVNFRPWEATNNVQLLEGEKSILANVNDIRTAHGKKKLSQLSDLFPVAHALLTTWPELDHFNRTKAEWIGPIYHVNYGKGAAWPCANRPYRLLIYLRPSNHLPELLTIFSAIDASIIAIIPGIPEKLMNQFSSSHCFISDVPVRLDTVINTASLVISYAGHGFVTTALAHGIPLLLIPTNVEQFLLAKRVHDQRLGIALSPKEIPHQVVYAMRRLIENHGYKERAMTFSKKYSGTSPTSTIETILGRINQIILSK